MGTLMRCCLQSILKLVNSVIGMVGIGMVLYSLWMIRVYYKHPNVHWTDHSPPWFICVSLGLGVFVCFVSCSGHVAAETSNGHCLSCYMFFIFLLIAMEAAITADVFLNRNWEEDFPKDPTGRFESFKNFLRSNFEMCEWIGFVVVAAEGLCMFLSMILRALGPDHGIYCDRDEENMYATVPLLGNQVQQAPPYFADPLLHK
ncbi:Tetraspanin-19 [Ananas comosus]|uniref:Tetraspanin-19 n=1 Tax=Ananas comosus TaxID=4615 RepID=A0A199VWI3_ANACO|nr:Tetraspanin-19 [Ananas comosus]